ncbi:MAG TPA: hypothetical protein DIC37_18090 [Pseudomonas sp.]|nr:hypothetical protein [Pseudomonas sp.]
MLVAAWWLFGLGWGITGDRYRAGHGEASVTIDFSKGRYEVFKGRVPGQLPIGRIDDDEYVRSPSNELLYRVDGDEFYDIKGNYLGEIVESGPGRAMVVDSNHYCLFVIAPE